MNIELILPKASVRSLVNGWLLEDTPSFDYGSVVLPDKEWKANLYCKESCVLAGVPFVNEVFEQVDCKVNWIVEEGATLEASGTNKIVVAEVTGKVSHLLRGERIALNCITRASGIAALVSRYTKLASEAGWTGRIACTRKTTPGFRLVEKYAVLIGGGDPHRYDLSSMVMLKDNHCEAARSIQKAVEGVRNVGGFSVKIEVEARNRKEAFEAIQAGADVVMLDNFSAKDAKAVASELRSHNNRTIIEVSGGLNENNIRSYFDNNIDVISMSALTQGYPTVDFSMKLAK